MQTDRVKDRRAGRVMDLRTLLDRAVGSGVSPPEAAGVQVRDVCDDSRVARPGSLFVAVAGTRANGAVFADDAASRGAVAIVTDGEVSVGRGLAVVKVKDARRALARLAAVFHGLDRIQADGGLSVTGITGTNGKSTVAYMVRSILGAAGEPVALLGTIEYDLVGRAMRAELTTPGPVLLTRHLVEAHASGARHVVMEVSSHSLDQRRTDGIRFSAAVFTNLTQDHLDYHETREDYLEAKRRLFADLPRDAVAVVNGDEPASERIVEGCRARVIRYGFGDSADVRGRVLEAGRGGSRFVVSYRGEDMEVRTTLAGQYNVSNALAAASVGWAMAVEPSTIARGLSALSRVPGRLERVDCGTLGFDVFVDYAHTDDALKNVLGAVRPLTRGALWCVFGCGGDRDRTKRPLMAKAVAAGSDRFVVTSDNPRTEDPAAIIADIEAGLTGADRARSVTLPDRAAAIGRAIDELLPGDTLVIAGKGHEDYQILGTEKVHFDDVETAREAVELRKSKG